MWSFVIFLIGILWFFLTIFGVFDLEEDREGNAIVLGYYIFYVIWALLGKDNFRFRLFMILVAGGVMVTGLGGMTGLWAL